MSIKVSMDIQGLQDLKAAFDRIGGSANADLGNALIVAGFNIQREAKLSLAEHGSVSHTETRYNPKRVVDVSAEGSPPNSDTGRLQNSIFVNVDADQGGVQSVSVGTNVKYGTFLEFGTTNMRARPWLFPAFEGTKAKNVKLILSAIKESLKKNAKGVG